MDSLTLATWVLAAATVVLAVATYQYTQATKAQARDRAFAFVSPRKLPQVEGGSFALNLDADAIVLDVRAALVRFDRHEGSSSIIAFEGHRSVATREEQRGFELGCAQAVQTPASVDRLVSAYCPLDSTGYIFHVTYKTTAGERISATSFHFCMQDSVGGPVETTATDIWRGNRSITEAVKQNSAEWRNRIEAVAAAVGYGRVDGSKPGSKTPTTPVGPILT